MSYKLNYTAEEKIKLAKDNSAEKLYESKKNQRTMRVLTVLAYILTVSLAAIVLSAYYIFLWRPASHTYNAAPARNVQCEKIIIPEITAENIAIRLYNETDLTLDTYLAAIIKYLSQEEVYFNSMKPLQTATTKLNRNEFNQYLNRASRALVATSQKAKMMADEAEKKNDQKNRPDDDDDIEISGDKEITTNYPNSDIPQDLNDTTNQDNE